MKTIMTAGLLGLLITGSTLAEELQSDWIEPVPGFAETVLGVEIRSVDAPDTKGQTRVTLSVPKSSLANNPNIHEVVVVAERSGERQTRKPIRHEWVSNYDDDHYGLVLYLGKNEQIPFRLYFDAGEH